MNFGADLLGHLEKYIEGSSRIYIHPSLNVTQGILKNKIDRRSIILDCSQINYIILQEKKISIIIMNF